MQAIILAAGMGKRLGEFTSRNTKCMLKVNERRLIDRMLEQLSAYNLTRIVIVTGYEGKNLRDHVTLHHTELPIFFVDNPIFDKTNNIYSLWLARKELAEDDTILLESDVIFHDSVLRELVETPYHDCALVSHYETWMDGTMVEIGESGDILNFIPKIAFKFSNTKSYYKTVNIYKFSREFLVDHYLPFLDAYLRVLGENEYYEQVLRVITLIDRTYIKALPVSGTDWYEIDDIQDLRIAEILFAEPEKKLEKIKASEGGYWRFPGMLDFSHPSNPYFPTQKIIDEIKANFEPLLKGKPSGVGVNSMLASKFFGLSQDLATVGSGVNALLYSLIAFEPGKIGIDSLSLVKYKEILPEERICLFSSQREDMSLSVDDLISYYNAQDVEAIILVNPDNIFGRIIPEDELLKLSEWCENQGKRLIIDQTNSDFADEEKNFSLLNSDLLKDHPKLIVLKSVSEGFGVEGLSLGIAASGDHDLMKNLKKESGRYGINSFAEFFMQIYNKYEKEYVVSCGKVRDERRIFAEELKSISWLKVYDSQANFLLCEVSDNEIGRKITERLLADFNILVDSIQLSDSSDNRMFIRIGIKKRQENRQLTDALRSL